MDGANGIGPSARSQSYLVIKGCLFLLSGATFSCEIAALDPKAAKIRILAGFVCVASLAWAILDFMLEVKQPDVLSVWFYRIPWWADTNYLVFLPTVSVAGAGINIVILFYTIFKKSVSETVCHLIFGISLAQILYFAGTFVVWAIRSREPVPLHLRGESVPQQQMALANPNA